MGKAKKQERSTVVPITYDPSPMTCLSYLFLTLRYSLSSRPPSPLRSYFL